MDKNPQALSGSSLVLLVDREDLLGSNLSSLLEKSSTVVLVSKEKSAEERGVIFVPFLLPVPKIPEGMYSRIVFVWSEESKHILEPLVKKAAEWRVPLFVILPEENEKALEEIQVSNATILILGDMFGGQSKQSLDKLLESAKAVKRITLAGMGLHAWHPILYADALKNIAKIVISADVTGKSLFVGPPHQMTALGIAHLLQKIDPEIRVDFSGEEKERQRHRFVSTLDTYDAGGQLRDYFRTLRVGPRRVDKKEEVVAFSRKPMHKKKGKGWYVMYVLLVFLFLPFVLVAGSGGLGMLFLSGGIQDAEKGKLLSAKQKTDAAVAMFAITESSTNAISMVNSFAIKSNAFESIRRQIIAADQLAIAADEMVSAGEKLSGVIAGKSSDVQGDTEGAVSSIKHVSILLSSVSRQDVPQSLWDTVDKAKTVSSIASGVVDELPQLLGVRGDRKYLILFQNNMELRPGGGFIGSYGLLTLHMGAVTSFAIHDVYDADGQLKGHVEPPFAIRRYIPIVHLYLRDSNFDGDFASDAKTAAYMLSQETGDRVDGVMGIDLNVLKGILASVGNVYVPSYNQTVTEANFFQLLEEHAEKNFFPGSTQKKDFLNAFASALFARLQHGISGRILLSKMMDAVRQKHIAFGLADPLLQTPFTIANLSGSLTDLRASQSGGFNDFLGIVEANLGINKVNAFVTRKVSQDVVMQDNGDIRETVSLSLSNNSDGSWPGGIYKNYIRFVLPKDAQLAGISLDNVDQKIVDAVTDPKIYESKTFIAPKGLEVAREDEDGKVLYGFLINVPIRTTTEITVSYIISHAYTDSLEKSYHLMVWKQMGIDGYPYQLHITMPDSMKLLSSSVPVVQQDQSISFNGTIDRDATLSFRIASK